MIALRGIPSLDTKSPMITSHKGNIAPIIEPRPAEIYCTPHVLSPLLIIKFRKLRTSIGTHSFPRGSLSPLITKKPTYNKPANTWRIPAICNAGIYRTPSFEAIQVVPQKKHTSANAKNAFDLVPFLCIVSGLNTASFFSESVED